MKQPAQTTAQGPARRGRWWIAGVLLAALGAAAAVDGPVVRDGKPVAAPAWAGGIRAEKLSSEYCITCHEEAGKQWRGSTHQLANQQVNSTSALASFQGETARTFAADYRFTQDQDSRPRIEERRRDGSLHEHRPAMAIGHATLRAMVIETEPGTFQATEVAWAPAKRDWFSTFRRRKSAIPANGVTGPASR